METLCCGLKARLEGRRILSVNVVERRLRCLIDRRLAERLKGKTIVQIGRRAKYILISLSCDMVWMIHLGMSGKLIRVDPRTPKQKHDHIVVSLDSGQELRYHDPRRFGLSLVVAANELHELPQLKHLRLDPFDPGFNGSYLYSLTKQSDRLIRDLMLDQPTMSVICS